MSTQPPDLSKVDQLLEQLQDNLKHAKLSLEHQRQLLVNVKLATRQPTKTTPLFDKKTITLLATYGLERDRDEVSKEALRCLANILLLNPPSRQAFVDSGHGPDLAERLRDCDAAEEFLCARLLFLLTYNTSLDFERLVRDHQLADSIVSLLGTQPRNSAALGEPTNQQSMAMSELLRLVFNVQHFNPSLQKDFIRMLPSLSTILVNTDWPPPILQAPLASVINAILSLDLKSAVESSQAQQSSPYSVVANGVVHSLIRILDRSIQEHSEQELEQGAAPLCTLLRRIHELGDTTIQHTMKTAILPTVEDRRLPLGQGESFSARLLRLTTSPQLPTLRENISSLLYELSDKNPDKFVHNVGYGYASGFLMSHNIAVPVEASTNSATEELDVNPVTGQDISSQVEEPLPEMTEEEKEREAERLFILFERLKATGVVDVKNPVEQLREQQ